MMVSLYSVLTVIAGVWILAILFTMVLGDNFAMVICLIMTLASVGLALYRIGELLKVLVGG